MAIKTEPDSKQNAPIWLKLFVLFHLIAITVWALPTHDWEKNPPTGTNYILYANSKYLRTFPPVQNYLFITGFWQYWDMFAPNPAQTDIWCDAVVTYRDGTKKVYQYPRMFMMNLPQKYVAERYRKFFERVNQDQYSYIWPVFAQRIAFLNDDLKNPPRLVTLRRHWHAVQPPGMPDNGEYSSYAFFTYVVDPAKLAKDRKGLW